MSKAQKVEPFADLEIAPVLRKQRLFEAGQMKLLALHLISFAPKYGYDLIKEVGEIVGGGYCPSAGTIYPTLNYLEEQQFVQVALDGAERKQYRITTLGLKHLEVEHANVEKILSCFDMRKQIQNNEQYLDIKRGVSPGVLKFYIIMNGNIVFNKMLGSNAHWVCSFVVGVI